MTIYQIREAVEKTKAPFIEASKAAEKATKNMLFNAFIEILDAIADSVSNAAPSKYQKVTKIAPYPERSIKQYKEKSICADINGFCLFYYCI